MLKLIQFFVITLIISQAEAVAAQGSISSWHPTVIAVTQTVAGRSGRLYTRLELAKHGDARITYEQEGDGQQLSGTILVISGRWLLVKGMHLEKGRAVELMKIEGINSQLLLTLLSRGLPDGPPPAGQTRKISIIETKEPIRVASAGTNGIYLAPWSVNGTVTSASVSTLNYSLDLKDGRGRNPDTHLEGSVSNPGKMLEFPDSMRLSGWVVDKIGSYKEQTSSGTVLNYGASKTMIKARTLGELRAGNAR